MKSAVIIKGNKYGFQIVLHPDLTFEQLVPEVEKRFRASGAFFDKNKPVAVSFSGRPISEEEQDLLVDTIQRSSNLVVSYVIEGAKAHETRYARALEDSDGYQASVVLQETAGQDKPSGRQNYTGPEKGKSSGASDPSAGPVSGETKEGRKQDPAENGEKTEGFGIISRILSGGSGRPAGEGESGNKKEAGSKAPQAAGEGDGSGPVFPEDEVGKHGQFYRGILRSGQKIEVDGSFVILGDVNPGAQIIAGGNVVILGSLKGTVYAGYPSDRNAIVAALNMEPMQIQIGDFIARSADAERKRGRKPVKKKKQSDFEARMAFVDDGNICIEKIDRKLIGEISGRAQQQ